MTSVLNILTGNVVLLSATSFFLQMAIYFAAIRIMLYRFKKKYNRAPVFNGMFRLYSKSLISNAPSKREKEFYMTTNKMTVVFNSLLVMTVFVFLIMCFR